VSQYDEKMASILEIFRQLTKKRGNFRVTLKAMLTIGYPPTQEYQHKEAMEKNH
jgi:hypothetical protein